MIEYSPSKRSARARRTWLIALSLAGALVGLTALLLLHLRSEAIGSQTRELRLLSLALTEEVGRGLQGAEEGFNEMKSEIRQGRLTIRGAEANKSLRTHADLMPLVQYLWLVDGQGHTLASSDRIAPPSNVAFAPALSALSSDELALSRPFSMGPGQGRQVAIAVRFPATATQTGGWIIAAMPSDALLGAFSAASPSADARMAVFRSDGVKIAGEIIDAPTATEAQMAQRLSNMKSEYLHRFRDGSDRLVALHRLHRYGLAVVLTRDLGVMLMGWREAVRLACVAVALLLGAFGACAYFVARADRRHEAAQQALQAQQSRTAKFNSLGALAGAVAHDFNNVLAAILGYGEMAQDVAAPDSAQRRYIDLVVTAAMRGKTMVERILTFSGAGARAASVFELEPIVEEVLAMLPGSLRGGIVLERRLHAGGARLRGDPTQAFQAIMNLCANAAQAMPEGGKLTVQLERIATQTAQVLSHSQLDAGHYLQLSVSDEGSGISAAVMERLFEPFFTTRKAQSGTGLGLAVVLGIVGEFGGAVDVRNAPTSGSVFTLYFPECEEDMPEGKSPSRSPQGQGQTLMVVDDDPALVEMVSEILRGLGYHTVGYTNAASAMQALLSNSIPFSAVITDEVMPELSGTGMTERIRELGLRLPVLLLSGYGGPLLAARAAAAGVTQVILKPARRADLARALAEEL